jgi:hypothetical protein
VIFKDLKITSSSNQEIQQQTIIFERLRNKPFWIWDGIDQHKIKDIRTLSPFLSQLTHNQLYPLWQESLHVLARRTRKDLFIDLSKLMPVFIKLGGEQQLSK